MTASGVKSFIVQSRIHGREHRISLGRASVLTTEQARKEAKRLLGEIATGLDPLAERARERLKSVTLGEVLQSYLAARKDLKPYTIYDLQVAMKGLSDWMHRPVVSITRDMVARRHAKLGERSHARANVSMKYLRAVLNFAACQYTDAQGRPLIVDNPVRMLSATRAWYRVERRRTVIKPHQLKPWFEAVLSLSDAPTARDFLLLLILTGLRNREAITLEWANVDLIDRTLTIHDTKNHEPHTLPLADYVFTVMKARYANRINGYVFPKATGRGYMGRPSTAINRVIAASGVKFTPHDLRRSFATTADAVGVPAYALNALLNHKGVDVTAGYIVRGVQSLREPMQRIETFLLEKGGVR